MKLGDKIFRSWYYLQLGWQLYFAIIFAFINFITVMYAFVIDDYQFLQIIFPNYFTFALIFSVSVFILCTCVGYRIFHSRERRAQIDINFEINPYAIRRTVNSEMILKTYVIMSNLLVLKNQQKESVDAKRIEEYMEELNSIKDIMKKRTMQNKLELKYIKTETQEEVTKNK